MKNTMVKRIEKAVRKEVIKPAHKFAKKHPITATVAGCFGMAAATEVSVLTTVAAVALAKNSAKKRFSDIAAKRAAKAETNENVTTPETQEAEEATEEQSEEAAENDQ